MTCQELRERLPGDSPDILRHAEACESCRRERALYHRDLKLFEEGFMNLAKEMRIAIHPRRAVRRSLVPLGVVAAMLLGVMALVIVPAIRRVRPSLAPLEPVEQVDADTARRRAEARGMLAEPPVRRGRVTGTAEGSGHVSITVEKPGEVREGDEFTICRNGGFVAKVIVVAVYDRVISAQIAFRESEPQLGDDVFETVPIPPADRKAALDFVFSFHALDRKDREAIDGALADLAGEDVQVRKRAVKDLISLGGPARLLLARLDPVRETDEVRLRLKEVWERWARLEEIAGGPGLEYDLEFLSLVDDARAYDRLKRILSRVRPFSTGGFPERGAGLAATIRAWWGDARGRVGWNAPLDRYEEKAR